MSFFDKKYLQGNYYLRGNYHIFTDMTSEYLINHKHNRPEIMGVVSGEAIIPLENQNIVLRSGDMIFIDSNVQHGNIIKQNTKMFSFQFSFSRMEGPIKFSDLARNEVRLKKFLENKKPYFIFHDEEDIFLSVRQYNRAMALCRNYYASIILSEIIVKIATIMCNDKFGKGEGMEHVKKAMEFVRDNFHKQISLKEVSKYVNLNESYFSRLFKRQMGITLTDYINKYKIDVAKIYLYDKNTKIIDVCESIGISSRQYFTYLFTKLEGMTPQNYRNMLSGNEYDMKNVY